MLLAADSGGFGTLKKFIRSERFSVFIDHGLKIRALW
jgi:hypothetical protein